MLQMNDHVTKLKLPSQHRTRILTVLQLNHINTIKDLVSRTPSELLRFRKFGRYMFKVIEQSLSIENFFLRDKPLTSIHLVRLCAVAIPKALGIHYATSKLIPTGFDIHFQERRGITNMIVEMEAVKSPDCVEAVIVAWVEDGRRYGYYFTVAELKVDFTVDET